MAATARQIWSVMINLATLALRITQTCIDPTYNGEGELVFDNFSLLDNSVSCSKLLFITAYHAPRTEGSTETIVFAVVCLFGSILIVITIIIHQNRNYKTWARIRIVGMAILMVLGIGLLGYGMLMPMDHAWHTVAVPSIIFSLVWPEVSLLIRTQIMEDGGNQHLLRDLLMKLGETPISIKRCVDLIQNPDIPWNAQKILLLLGSGPPMLIGACQIGWMVYKADIISKVGSGFPVLIRTCRVRWTAYKTGITFKVVGWLRKIPRVFRVEEDLEEQAAGAAMEGNGDGDATEKVVPKEVVGIIV